LLVRNMEEAEPSAPPHATPFLSRARPWGVLLIALLSLSLGFGTYYAQPRPNPGTHHYCSDGVGALSSIIGWCYFACWSVSFYPQLVLNWERRSVVGLSFDYPALNTVGFACYATFNMALYFSPSIRREYERRHDGHAPAVRLNDIVFALHAVVLSVACLWQIAIYERGSQRFSPLCKLGIAAFSLSLPVLLLLAAHSSTFGWLDMLYALSYVKLGVTLVKYTPQAYLNWQRQSTDGWNIDNVVLDFSGGSLSLGQLFLDASCARDWSAITGDPVKFALGFTSMVFDTVFLLQHFCLYSPTRRRRRRTCPAPLLLDPKPFGDGRMDGAVEAGLAPTLKEAADERTEPLLLNER
jgi:cystinosin